MPLEKAAWLTTAIACAITAVVLLLTGYVGYAMTAAAVGIAAAINLS